MRGGGARLGVMREGVLPPGEYWAYAPQPMPEPVSRVWRVRGDAEKITVKPGQMVQVRVEVREVGGN